jgi:hypothetical protein
MAAEQPVVDAVHTLIAGEDLRLMQYHAVKICCWSDFKNCSQVRLCGDGQKPCGILQNNPNIGEEAIVMRAGKSKAVIAEAICCDGSTPLDSWASDVNGHLVIIANHDWVGGMFHERMVMSATPGEGDIGTVDVECLNPWLYHALQ